MFAETATLDFTADRNEGNNMAEYIVPCNPKYYKVEEAFNDLKILDWKQSNTKIAIHE